MTTAAGDRLYQLLPSLYRHRDAALGEPLRALFVILEQELEVLEADIEGLYENWFIETCEEWVVAYLGDLLGVSQLSDEQHLVFSQRARVANTLAYRRRKGTVEALHRVVQDATGWQALAIEHFQRVTATQHVQHVRRDRGATIDVRRLETVERRDEPFDATARRVDVRRIAAGRGTHNLPNVGVFVWRVPSYPLSHAATPVVGEPAGRFMFDVLGRDLQLFTRPTARIDAGAGQPEHTLALPIGRRTFAADLAAYAERHAGTPVLQRPAETNLYGLQRSLAVVRDGVLVSPSRVAGADLGEWTRPKSGVAIDVERGRIAFAPGEEPSAGVVVSYCYGFSTDLGGGPYDRRPSLSVASPHNWHATVASTRRDGQTPAFRFTTLREAVDAWRDSGQPGLIEILDSEAYDLHEIDVAAGHELGIQAVDGARPAILSTPLTVRGASRTSGVVAPTLSLNGCIIAGPVRISGRLDLTVKHCCIPSGLEAVDPDSDVHLALERSSVGAVRGSPSGTAVALTECIVEGRVTASVFCAERTTLLGETTVREMTLASESIFAREVTVERRHAGALRFCYVPEGSSTPQRFRCQPDLALADADPRERARIGRRVTPVFTSTRFGEAGFAQLSNQCAAEVSAGAEDGSEIGAFHHLHQPQRAALLRAIVEEYLPLGLEAGIRYMS